MARGRRAGYTPLARGAVRQGETGSLARGAARHGETGPAPCLIRGLRFTPTPPPLYRLSSRVWGDGALGTSVYVDLNPPTNAAIGVPVYGRIPARQSVAEGRYTGSLTVVMIF